MVDIFDAFREFEREYETTFSREPIFATPYVMQALSLLRYMDQRFYTFAALYGDPGIAWRMCEQIRRMLLAAFRGPTYTQFPREAFPEFPELAEEIEDPVALHRDIQRIREASDPEISVPAQFGRHKSRQHSSFYLQKKLPEELHRIRQNAEQRRRESQKRLAPSQGPSGPLPKMRRNVLELSLQAQINTRRARMTIEQAERQTAPMPPPPRVTVARRPGSLVVSSDVRCEDQSVYLERLQSYHEAIPFLGASRRDRNKYEHAQRAYKANQKRKERRERQAMIHRQASESSRQVQSQPGPSYPSRQPQTQKPDTTTSRSAAVQRPQNRYVPRSTPPPQRSPPRSTDGFGSLCRSPAPLCQPRLYYDFGQPSPNSVSFDEHHQLREWMQPHFDPSGRDRSSSRRDANYCDSSDSSQQRSSRSSRFFPMTEPDNKRNH